MTTKRSYHDACGMAHALDLVGERWALLVVRELLLGPKRYSDLLADLPGISTNVLSHRLTELERSGVLGKRRLPPPAASQVYELTDWGQELEPVITLFGRWGARSPVHPRDAQLSVNSFVLSLRTNFAPGPATGFRADYELRLAGRPFHATVEGGRFRIEPGAASGPDAVLTAAEPRALAGVIYGGFPLAEAIADGAVSVTGELAAVERLSTLFPLPAPATAAAPAVTPAAAPATAPVTAA